MQGMSDIFTSRPRAIVAPPQPEEGIFLPKGRIASKGDLEPNDYIYWVSLSGYVTKIIVEDGGFSTTGHWKLRNSMDTSDLEITLRRIIQHELTHAIFF